MEQNYLNQPIEPLEPYRQPSLPRRTGRRRLSFILLCAIIPVSAAASLIGLFGGADFKRLASAQTDHPVVVGQAEPDSFEPTDSSGAAGLTITDLPEQAQDDPAPSGGEWSLPDIYEHTIDSVVCVQVSSAGSSAVGSGVILSSDGYIITNYHVVENMYECFVLLSDDSQYPAQLVGGDEQTDLAVLKIAAEGLTAATFGDSDQLRVGDAVVAIGNPLGTELRGTMTDGIVSAINRNIAVEGREMTLIQTNTAMNSGNSGGPLINAYGQVVGINTAKFSSYYSGTVEGIGFAIPIAAAKPIIDELITLGYVSGRPSLGIEGDSVPQYAQIYYHLPDGVYVAGVDESSDAFAQGIRPGDIIVALEDERVTSADELNAVKNRYLAGDTVTLTVYHGGYYYYIPVVLGEQGATN